LTNNRPIAPKCLIKKPGTMRAFLAYDSQLSGCKRKDPIS
jgi:hypothetical protein